MSVDEPLVVKAVDLSQWTLDNSENARGRLDAILQEYRDVEGSLRSKGEKKPDMQASSQLKHLTPTVIFGHVPGMLPGDVFKNRGELAVLGGHTQYSRGIDYRVADFQGARAIVLSGGYKDDADHGSTMWYTGQGGQKKKQQVEDQQWVRDNFGLKQNAQTGTPVRVFRGSRDSAGATQYTYEGLYAVKEARRVKSQDGPLICQFLLDGLPNGHSVASTKVEFKSMKSKKTYQPRTRLAAPDENSAPAVPRPSKKSKVSVIGSAEAPWGPIDRKAREARRAAAAKKPGLVSDDLSNGLEPHVPIPCYNELGDGAVPPRLNYTPDYKWHPGVKEQLSGVLKALDEQMLHYRGGHKCSMAFNQAMMLKDEWAQKQPEWLAMSEEEREELDQAFRKDAGNYNQQGCLFTVDWFGLHECGGSCTGEKCQSNKVVTRGITLPLEVYRDRNKGWSVRCPLDIPVGAFVCAYIGELVLEDEAHVHERSKDNEYLYSLDHFSLQATNNLKMGMNVLAREVPLYKVPPPPPPDVHSALDRYPPLQPASREMASSPQEQAAATPGQQQPQQQHQQQQAQPAALQGQQQPQQQHQQLPDGMEGVEEGTQGPSHPPCTNHQHQQHEQGQGQQPQQSTLPKAEHEAEGTLGPASVHGAQQQNPGESERVPTSLQEALQQNPVEVSERIQVPASLKHEAQQQSPGECEVKAPIGVPAGWPAGWPHPALPQEGAQSRAQLVQQGVSEMEGVEEAQHHDSTKVRQQQQQQQQQCLGDVTIVDAGVDPAFLAAELAAAAAAVSEHCGRAVDAAGAASAAPTTAQPECGASEGVPRTDGPPTAVPAEAVRATSATTATAAGAAAAAAGRETRPRTSSEQLDARNPQEGRSPPDGMGPQSAQCAQSGSLAKTPDAAAQEEVRRSQLEDGASVGSERAPNDIHLAEGGGAEGRGGHENGSGGAEEGDQGGSSRGRGKRRGRAGAKLATKAQRRAHRQQSKSQGPEQGRGQSVGVRAGSAGADGGQEEGAGRQPGRGQNGASGSGTNSSAGVEMIGEEKHALARSNMGIGQGVLGFGAPGVEEKPVDVGTWAEETQEWDNVLVIDARDTGNVARFVNHACGSRANLLVQPVFARDSNNQVLHYLALFAQKPIPKNTELTYDYGKAYSWPPGQQCNCGSPECRGLNVGQETPARAPAPRTS